MSEFGEVLLFVAGGVVFIVVTLLLGKLIRPNRPNGEKLSTYESGEEPISHAWTQFNVRFYIIAIVFLLFEVEIVLLFPWSTVFADKALIRETSGLWGWIAFAEALIFIFVLGLGLAYAWVNGLLDWIKPDPQPTEYRSPVPGHFYDAVNSKYRQKSNRKESKNEGTA